jgi:hypothetical protein
MNLGHSHKTPLDSPWNRSSPLVKTKVVNAHPRPLDEDTHVLDSASN